MGEAVNAKLSVVAVGRREVRLRVEQRLRIDRESAIDLTLAVALPKGDRQRWLVEKATELGVGRLVPISTRRSVVRLKESGMERLDRFVIEACKQCGRNRLMEIEQPVGWEEFLSHTNDERIRLIAHPSRTDFLVRPNGWTDLEVRPTTTPIVAAIGPEGGFTDEEVQSAAEAGWQAVSLGPRILRVETAALALAALVLLK